MTEDETNWALHAYSMYQRDTGTRHRFSSFQLLLMSTLLFITVVATFTWFFIAQVLFAKHAACTCIAKLYFDPLLVYAGSGYLLVPATEAQAACLRSARRLAVPE